MKRFLGAIAAMLMGSASALAGGQLPDLAAPIQLAFNPSPDPTVAGYALYYGEWSGTVTNRIDIADATSVRLTNLLAGRLHFFYAVSYTDEGIESLPSNTLYYSPVRMTRLRLATHPSGDMQLTFRVPPYRQCRIEYATSLLSPQWMTAGFAAANGNGEVEFIDPPNGKAAARFYRAVLLP